MKTRTRGQALTEFALILPILLLLLLGIIEGARIIWAYVTVQNAAREAARYGVTGQPYDQSGNPWTLRPDRTAGCNPQFDASGQLIYEGCPAGPNDRVDAIIGVALERGRQLGVDQFAIHPNVYTAATYVDEGGTLGVRVWGQETGSDTRVDYAGKEGLNVLVQVYYNVRLLDPIYAAIIPRGYVHLEGQVQMQNEGIDSALGAVPPAGIAPPEAPPGAPPPPPGQVNLPIVLSLTGSRVNAGENLDIKLEYHTPNGRYDIYFYSPGLGYVALCLGVQVDGFGSVPLITCQVPAETTPGTYQLVSIAAGGDPDPANHVGEGDTVEVSYPGQPLLRIAESSRWPPGSTITFELYAHLPCPEGKSPCPPFQEYDIALIGGPYLSPGEPIPPPVQVDATGSGRKDWTIPSTLAPGSYTAVTYQRDTIAPVIASTVLEVVPAKILIQGGNSWPAGATIRVHLRGHAPNRSYMLRWIGWSTGGLRTIDFGPVDTDRFGNTLAGVRFQIPPDTQNSSPPNTVHRIVSFEAGGSGEVVASTEVEVVQRTDPFLVVVGGTKWPAGSLIQIELHNHLKIPYKLYFGDTLIEEIAGDLIVNGYYQTTYVIPVDTPKDIYEIWTEDPERPGIQVASIPVDVTSVPLIRVREGSIVPPGSLITIELTQHPPNDSFDIYLDGNLLFSLPTDGDGEADRIYDLSLLPGLSGGPLTLESRQDSVVVASTQIYLIAPDLQVTNIQFPPGPPVDKAIPVTVTVANNSPVTVTNQYFDVDLYLDPLHAPTVSSQFPPGDYKRWLNTVPATGTAQVVFNLTLHSPDHTVYGRVDTSNYIVESNEANNIYQMTVTGGCLSEVTDALSSPANWSGVDYGDADIPPSTFTVSGGRINLVSDGSNTFGASDNMYLAYYNRQTIQGDFEVRVRMVEGPGDDAGERKWAKGGLEIRSAVGSASSPKVDLAVANSGDVGWDPGVQAGYRGASGEANRPGDGPGDGSSDKRVSYPVWLRIVRQGDRFTYYYSDSDSATPPAVTAWTPHGSVQLASMGDTVTVGLFNSSGHASNTDTSSFDNLHICLKSGGAPPPGDFPPGLQVCSGNLLQNSGFENIQLAPWTVPNGAVNKVGEEYQGQFAALMYTYIAGAHQRPALAQTFDMPDWVISSTTTIDLSLYKCVRDLGSFSGAEPADQLNAVLRSGATPAAISSPALVADGNTSNSGTCLPGDYAPYSADLAAAIKAAGRNPEDYASQPLQLFIYDFSSDLGICTPPGAEAKDGCYETNYYLDNVELEVCTTQPIPPQQPGKATIGGPLRVFLSGAPTPKPGVWVWAYQQGGQLLTTYSLHDSNYFFYNIDPGTYVVYSEYWDGPNLYSAFRTVTVGPNQTITNLSLLLR